MMACMAGMMMADVTASAQTSDSISIDTTLWYNQTQQLGEVVVKSRLPRTKLKGNSMVTVPDRQSVSECRKVKNRCKGVKTSCKSPPDTFGQSRRKSIVPCCQCRVRLRPLRPWRILARQSLSAIDCYRRYARGTVPRRVRPSFHAVPQTPFPKPMCIQATGPWNGPNTSSPFNTR